METLHSAQEIIPKGEPLTRHRGLLWKSEAATSAPPHSSSYSGIPLFFSGYTGSFTCFVTEPRQAGTLEGC